jgi:hypothetical protein
VHEELLEARQQSVTAQPEQGRFPKRLVAHPLGTIKRCRDQGDGLTRGRANVRAEMRLTVLAYNLKRVITTLGGKQLIAAVR